MLINGEPGLGTAVNNVIQGNYLGTDATGAKRLSNGGRGIDLSGATNTLVGGTNASLRNVISGNLMQGITLHNGAAGNIVQGNFIGTEVTGTARLGNDFEGVVLENAPGNRIGGTASGAGNVISGNGLAGVHLLDAGSQDNFVQGNFIGTDRTAAKQIGNGGDGVFIKNAAHNRIGGPADNAGNTIRFNKGSGVGVVEIAGNVAKRDAIRGNSIADNAGIGIDLGNDGATANDGGDSDPGANKLQNHPVITSVTSSQSSLTIKGSLKSAPNKTFQIDVFANNSAHDVNDGQGRFFLGSTSVTTNGSGAASFSLTRNTPTTTALNVSASATDPAGNTSEFSATQSP